MDLKERYNYPYNITVELNMESSYNVSVKNNMIDYIVASNIASLVLAQMSMNANLQQVFEELLSKEGNELYSKPITSLEMVVRTYWVWNSLDHISAFERFSQPIVR